MSRSLTSYTLVLGASTKVSGTKIGGGSHQSDVFILDVSYEGYPVLYKIRGRFLTQEIESIVGLGTFNHVNKRGKRSTPLTQWVFPDSFP